MVIQHNISAINSYRNLGTNQSALSKNLEKLSSGYKINRAGDNAAGLAISESMRSQINGLNQAVSNANDSIGLIQTAEGALTETHAMLQRMTTLATQAANGTYNSIARANIQSEINDLVAEMDRVANYTDFNGIKPLAAQNGYDKNAALGMQKSYRSGIPSNVTVTDYKMTFQIGPSAPETITLKGQSMTASGIFGAAGWTNQPTETGTTGAEIEKSNIYKYYSSIRSKTETEAQVKKKAQDALESLKAVSTTGMSHQQAVCSIFYVGTTNVTYANRAVAAIKDAINTVSTYRAQLGAKQNRLEHTINSLKVTSENITAAESRIRDTDMADEITSYTKNNILLQAAQSMLSQANATPQGVLSLLQ